MHNAFAPFLMHKILQSASFILAVVYWLGGILISKINQKTVSRDCESSIWTFKRYIDHIN